jgi:glycosyltransferase involved in cell wall biosynthesis
MKRMFILDNYYPNPLSRFRYDEFNWFIDRYNETEVYTTAGGLSEGNNRAFNINDLNTSPDLFYTVFLGNAQSFYPLFEKFNTQFSFLLYPGGGFYYKHIENLEEIAQSELLETIIVNQPLTKKICMESSKIPDEKVKFIFGGPVDTKFFEDVHKTKRYYTKDKDTFDICFVAFRYDPYGISKGLDTFMKVAKELIWERDVRIHIVGETVGQPDLTDYTILGEKVNLYGAQQREFFKSFYPYMDMIISPNIPDEQFDGFPTGCCVVAGLCGVPILCTDVLNNKYVFEDDRHFKLIDTDVNNIVNIVLEYKNNLDKLYRMGDRGRMEIKTLFDLETQMKIKSRILGL